MPYAQTQYNIEQLHVPPHHNLQQAKGFATSYAQAHYTTKNLHSPPHLVLQFSQGLATSYAQTQYKFKLVLIRHRIIFGHNH
jgi:hypothetical protein